MDKKQELQLLPGTKKRLGIKTPGENKFLYIGSAIFGATLVMMFALNQYTDNLSAQIDELNNKIIELESKRDKSGEADLISTKEYIEKARGLVENHIYWTMGLDAMVGLLQNGVRLTSLSGDIESKNLIISIEVSDYSTLARQIASLLTEPRISDLSISEIKPLSSGILETDIGFKIDVDNLLKKIK